MAKSAKQAGTPDPLLPIDEIASQLGFQAWDVLLAGDGSGVGWPDPSGWACILVDRRSRLRCDFVGAVNRGSINFAELMPYFQALLWYDHFHRDTWKARGDPFCRVVILTDHRALVDAARQAADPDAPLPRAQAPIWAAFRQLRLEGYLVSFVWLPREAVALNSAADRMSKAARSRVVELLKLFGKELNWVNSEKQPATIYDFNPQA